MSAMVNYYSINLADISIANFGSRRQISKHLCYYCAYKRMQQLGPRRKWDELAQSEDDIEAFL